ncbi:hypothetical protein [Cellulomonas iranensis]|uniref:hypothetical protein n=1 Tax=Cellulomonas iranensis TaxID=76862 RepID=UPI000B3D096D|nr:hypothetical protein [Cellulomonas iranensis]
MIRDGAPLTDIAVDETAAARRADVVHPRGERVRCAACGASIVLVRIRPNAPVRGRRTRIPLEASFDPATSPVVASHALAPGRRDCRPITADDPIAPHELPALTHFATCPARRRTTIPEET